MPVAVLGAAAPGVVSQTIPAWAAPAATRTDRDRTTAVHSGRRVDMVMDVLQQGSYGGRGRTAPRPSRPCRSIRNPGRESLSVRSTGRRPAPAPADRKSVV